MKVCCEEEALCPFLLSAPHLPPLLCLKRYLIVPKSAISGELDKTQLLHQTLRHIAPAASFRRSYKWM